MTKQAMLYVFDRDQRPAGLADRGAAGAEGRRAGRMVLADAAVPDQAASRTIYQGVVEEPDRLHAGAARRGAEERREVQDSGRSSRRRSSAGWRGRLPASDRRAAPTGRAAPTIPKRTSPSCRRSRRSRPSALMPPPSKEFSDVDYVGGLCRPGVRYISGPGEDAGADAPVRGRGAAPATPTASGAPAAPAPPGAPAAGRGAAPAPLPTTTTGEAAVSLNPQGLPLLKPPYGQITAINMDTGEFVWQVAHGETPDACAIIRR